MQQYIRVGMTEQPRLMRNIHAADNQLAPCHQPMDVAALNIPACWRRKQRVSLS